MRCGLRKSCSAEPKQRKRWLFAPLLNNISRTLKRLSGPAAETFGDPKLPDARQQHVLLHGTMCLPHERTEQTAPGGNMYTMPCELSLYPEVTVDVRFVPPGDEEGFGQIVLGKHLFDFGAKLFVVEDLVGLRGRGDKITDNESRVLLLGRGSTVCQNQLIPCFAGLCRADWNSRVTRGGLQQNKSLETDLRKVCSVPSHIINHPELRQGLLRHQQWYIPIDHRHLQANEFGAEGKLDLHVEG